MLTIKKEDMNKIKNTFRAGFVVAAGLVAMYSCTDTWDDHYNAPVQLDYEGTTMQAIEENASNFAKVIKAYGYERELTSDNIYTIWAPADDAFDVSKYIDENGNAIEDSTEVVTQFIKNHIARYARSVNGKNQDFNLMNEKRGSMSAEGKFGDASIAVSNIACKNGVLHIITEESPYSFNLFELIAKQYKDDTDEGKDTLSLYAFLYDEKVNKDSLIEDKSVSRGVDENGDKIWVDSFVMRNNTVLKNVDAKLYEEDSSFIAIIPSAKAWTERYKIAESLLVFNPFEDERAPGACDSLQRHYANMFAMSDLYFNRNANEHWQDSLKSTTYGGFSPWYEHVYYSKMPKNLPEDVEVNDILSKCGDPIECSNGIGYIVDEYPMSEYEQFFKKIKVSASSSTINKDLDKNGKPKFTKNTNDNFRTYGGTFYSTLIDTVENVVLDRKNINYRFTDIVPASGSANPVVGFDVPNTLSGTYDIYLVTCPIWMVSDYNNIPDSLLDIRPYRFYTTIFERDEDGEYPSSGLRLVNPIDLDEDGDSTNYFTTIDTLYDESGHRIVNDTTFLGTHKFKNAYYGRNDEGVVIQLQSQISSKLKDVYSREMLISSIILKPHGLKGEDVIITPGDAPATEAKMRKGTMLTNSNKRK